MNLYLEKRPSGIYYFRQTRRIDKKQVVKRVSLKTRDIKLARHLAIQLIADIQMDKYKKFDVEYHQDGTIKKLNINGADDLQAYREYSAEYNKALEDSRQARHRIEQERIELEASIRRRNAELEEAKRDKSEDAATIALREKLMNMPVSMPRLLKEYLENIQVTEGVKGRYRRNIQTFIEYSNIQGVKALTEVTRKFVHSYIGYLRQSKDKEDKTIKLELNVLSTFFNYQYKAGEIDKNNPFSGHVLKYESEPRTPFTADELDKIFSSSLMNNEQARFILLLLLTSSARPNEICQLDGNDIVLETDIETGQPIYVIKIRPEAYDEDGVTPIDTKKSVKTPHSKREIYLHNLLIQNGFVDYLETRKNKKLFDLKLTKQKTFATQFSEDFTRVLRDELKIPKKTLYCFRHTSCNLLARKRVVTFARENLMGHLPKGENEGTYTQKLSPQELKDLTEEPLYFHSVKSLHN